VRPLARALVRARIFVRGPLGERSGWVVDFAEIKDAFKPYYDQLDHHYLNEVEGLENPTSEVLARWIYEKLRPQLPGIRRVELYETCTAGAVYSGEDA